jgi:hypothetical protein
VFFTHRSTQEIGPTERSWSISGCQDQDQKIAASLHSTAPTGDGCASASHHSIGRAVARLQLLILIHPPLREAEWRRSSGGRRVAPCGEAAHIERRSSRSRPEAMPPDECRNEGTPSPSEVPDAGAKTFASFGAFAKGSRRKGETISRHHRSNGYAPSHPKTWSAQRPPRPKERPKLTAPSVTSHLPDHQTGL